VALTGSPFVIAVERAQTGTQCPPDRFESRSRSTLITHLPLTYPLNWAVWTSGGTVVIAGEHWQCSDSSSNELENDPFRFAH